MTRLSKLSWFKKALLLSFIATTVSWILYACCSSFLPKMGIDIDGYMISYYQWKNKRNNEIPKDDKNDILIINTEGLEGTNARGKIAELIGVVCEANPRVVGVDIRFPEREDSNNRKLQEVIENNSERIVLAEALYNGQLRRSYFDCDSISFGLTNLPSFSHYSNSIELNGEDIPLFSYRIAQKAYPDKSWDFNRFVVNYSSRSFQNLPAEAFLEADPSQIRHFVENKIILIGDLDNEKDFHEVPFDICGERWVIGLLLHAYPILSLGHDDVAFKRLRPVWDCLLSLILTFIFSLIFTYVTRLGDYLSGRPNNVYYYLYLIAKPFFIAFVEVIIFFICYYLITNPFGYAPRVIPYMISILIISGQMSGFISYSLTNKNDD